MLEANNLIANIQMVDLKSQYYRIKSQIDEAIINCIESTEFINGKAVQEFERAIAHYLNIKSVVSCANGTDALQIALMALKLQPGDEVIVPAFTYVATAEVIGLLRLVPVIIDVDPYTFNISSQAIEEAITPLTKAIIPVHLFGQCADMETIMQVAAQHSLYVIEDNAQAIGASYCFKNNISKKAGTIGNFGTTSFFPSKNLGCFGDGGAIYSDDENLMKQARMIANHGQSKKYIHDVVGINSRLDTLQAVILLEKLKHIALYTAARQQVANFYDKHLKDISPIEIPFRNPNSTHVFHQYTIKVPANQRDALQTYLKSQGIPSMVYYPLPLSEQKAYQSISRVVGTLARTEELCKQVLSLPIHTELSENQQAYIIEKIRTFFIHHSA